MSLQEEILKSNKLNAGLLAQVARLDAKTDPDAPLFNVFLKLDSTEPFTLPGVSINDIAGKIRTAHQVSLNGLKKLMDCSRVLYVEGSIQHHPLHNTPPRGPKF